jgi:hypothetical protein
VAEFWELTLPETYLAIKAYHSNQKDRREEMLTAAWLTAALTRTKRLPRLKNLITQSRGAKRLRGDELQKRRAEFEEMTAKWKATNEHRQ